MQTAREAAQERQEAADKAARNKVVAEKVSPAPHAGAPGARYLTEASSEMRVLRERIARLEEDNKHLAELASAKSAES